MREILFRGKRLDNEKWIYGGYQFEHGFGNPSHYIVEYSTFGAFTVNNLIEVYSDTVGQFTGLLDKNGNKIFEGDVVTDGNNEYEISFDKIGFDSAWNGLMGFALKRENELLNFNEIKYYDDPEDLEIIGNIHDNKEI